LDDCCAHRQTPLQVTDYGAGKIVCPYHGWTYDRDGTLCHVPSDPGYAQNNRCQIPTYQTLEKSGFIWIYPEARAQGQIPREDLWPHLDLDSYDRWPVCYLQKEFATSDELLIDNFMDPTHTAVVHDGLIRSSKNPTVHEMTVSTHRFGVRVDFAERQEKVGVGLRFIFGSTMRVQHTDEFLMPNLVRVTYTINAKTCFCALIACTPLGPLGSGRTLAHVQLRYHFGWPDLIVRLVIGRLGRKILEQDWRITADQFENMARFADASTNKVGADAVAFRVKKLRDQWINTKEPIEPSSQRIQLTF
jgi:hypothetical protein